MSIVACVAGVPQCEVLYEHAQEDRHVAGLLQERLVRSIYVMKAHKWRSAPMPSKALKQSCMQKLNAREAGLSGITPVTGVLSFVKDVSGCTKAYAAFWGLKHASFPILSDSMHCTVG